MFTTSFTYCIARCGLICSSGSAGPEGCVFVSVIAALAAGAVEGAEDSWLLALLQAKVAVRRMREAVRMRACMVRCNSTIFAFETTCAVRLSEGIGIPR